MGCSLHDCQHLPLAHVRAEGLLQTWAVTSPGNAAPVHMPPSSGGTQRRREQGVCSGQWGRGLRPASEGGRAQ